MRFWHFVSPRSPVLCDMFFRSSRPEVFCKTGIIRNFAKFTGKHLCQSLFLNKVPGLRPSAYNFNKKETLAQAFSCEFCEISKNTFCYRAALVATSGSSRSSEQFVNFVFCEFAWIILYTYYSKTSLTVFFAKILLRSAIELELAHFFEAIRL